METNIPTEFVSPYSVLRNQIWKEIMPKLMERRENGPNPTEEEISAGDFKEGFEPQCRDAVFEIRRRGYNTVTSGFSGIDNSKQYLMGFFTLDDSIKKILDSKGYRIGEEDGISHIEFSAISPDIVSLTSQWNTLANLFPNKGKPADYSTIPYAIRFREKYVS